MSMLASDNFAGIHPEVLDAIEKANCGHAQAYGSDSWTEKSSLLFKQHFGPHAEGFIVFNGTGANVCAINHLLKPWEAILCPESAHISNDECGAPQANTGSTLLTIKCQNGKISPELCLAHLHARGSQHHVQPAAISISQSTELGTVYTIEELERLGHFARDHNLLFIMDGARLCNAAARLKMPLKAISTDVGVDVLSFGGTKNGLMGAEAVIFLKPNLAENFKYVRKQQMQLASKMRFLSAQMIALLGSDLWLKNATHANQMANYLATSLKKNCPHIPIVYPVESNAVFVKLPSQALINELQKRSFFWVWDKENSIARWMTSWDTEPIFIDQFILQLKNLLDELTP